jgi:hypothetical protein
MDINVNIQAVDLAEAINNLADAITGIQLTGESTPAETTEPKRRKRKSKSESSQEGQALTDTTTTIQINPQQFPQPGEAVVPTTQPVATPPVQAPPPGYWPQATADGTVVQVPIPVSAPALQPAQPVYAALGQTPPQYQQPAAPPFQVSAPSYTMDQLGYAGMQLVDAGRREEVVQIMAQFGVTKLTDLPKERYAEYAMALRQRGAKI